VVAEGPPERVAEAAGSHTGRHLRRLLGRRRSAEGPRPSAATRPASPPRNTRGARSRAAPPR
jgi:hypothetical protein